MIGGAGEGLAQVGKRAVKQKLADFERSVRTGADIDPKVADNLRNLLAKTGISLGRSPDNEPAVGQTKTVDVEGDPENGQRGKIIEVRPNSLLLEMPDGRTKRVGRATVK